MEFIKTEPITSMKGAFSVEGLNVVVTGGNRGLGRGISEAFAECGANICVICRKQDKADEAAAQLAECYGVESFGVACDLGVYEQIEAAQQAVASKWDHIDVLVNNAGIDNHYSIFDDVELTEFKQVMDVNLNGVAATCKLFGAWMMDAARGGSIINISSIGGQAIGDPRSHPMPAYNASKAALDHFSRHMAIVMGDYGIRVNVIAPGLTHSALDADLPPVVGDYVDNVMPAHRFGEPLEIGALAVFLASPAGRQITGSVINHDGGIMTTGLTF